MTFSASQIAQLVQGRVEGNPDTLVGSFGKIEEAIEGQLSFYSNPKYEPYLYSTGASVILLQEGFALKQPVTATLIRVPDAYQAFATLLTWYEDSFRKKLTGVQQPCYIAPSASMGEEVFIGAFAYIGNNVKIGNRTKIFPQTYIGDNVTIGSDTILYPGVKVYHECSIGNKVIVHGGAVIGSDGFGFAPQADGSFKKIPQIGNVVVEDAVEIGSNTTIDRATMGSTRIRSGAKIDNLVQVAHNVEIGHSTVIASQAGISGSTRIGNGVMIGGQAGIVGHIQLGDGAKVNAQSGVSKSVDAGKAVTGSPAFDFTAALRSQAAARKLPELEKRVQELEQLLRQLLQEKKP